MGYNANKMTPTQRARISEIRDRFSKMGVDKTNDELLEIAKQSFPKQFSKKMKDGGAAFPDLTGDGKVTKKDILRGRGVKGFKDGGAVCRGMGSAMRGGSFSGVK